MYKRLVSAAVIFGMAALAPPAFAQQKCGPRDQLVTLLTDKYHEVNRGAGLYSSTEVVEFWASDETGSFSILLTYPNGMTCIIAAGQNWIEKPVLAVNNDPAT